MFPSVSSERDMNLRHGIKYSVILSSETGETTQARSLAVEHISALGCFPRSLEREPPPPQSPPHHPTTRPYAFLERYYTSPFTVISISPLSVCRPFRLGTFNELLHLPLSPFSRVHSLYPSAFGRPLLPIVRLFMLFKVCPIF